jgi:hypothetical protein
MALRERGLSVRLDALTLDEAEKAICERLSLPCPVEGPVMDKPCENTQSGATS